MGSFNFKSSGKTQEQQQIEKLEVSPTPIGIKTPLRAGESEGLFGMTFSLSEQVNDNLRNLLMTNWGERLGFYDLGANLRPLMSEFVSQDDFDSQAIERIRSTVSRWMPYIDLEDFSSEVDRTENKQTGLVRITITYNVPSLNIKLKKLQLALYVI
jgi:phage baseplate assembly protein W